MTCEKSRCSDMCLANSVNCKSSKTVFCRRFSKSSFLMRLSIIVSGIRQNAMQTIRMGEKAGYGFIAYLKGLRGLRQTLEDERPNAFMRDILRTTKESA